MGVGVYIPNMEKPKECGGCQFNVNQMGGSYEWQECVLLNEDITHFDIARDDCPLIEIDLVRCEECEWSNGECSVGERYQGGCTFGERRTDGRITTKDNKNITE